MTLDDYLNIGKKYGLEYTSADLPSYFSAKHSHYFYYDGGRPISTCYEYKDGHSEFMIANEAVLTYSDTGRLDMRIMGGCGLNASYIDVKDKRTFDKLIQSVIKRVKELKKEYRIKNIKEL